MDTNAPDADLTRARNHEHHGLPAHEVVLLLQSHPDRGLSGAEARERLGTFGPNALPATGGVNPLVRLLRQLNSSLVVILLAAGVVSLVLGEPVDAAVIFGVVLVNTVIGYVQEARAEAALDALRSMVRTEAEVVRDGRPRRVPSEDLVPGDVVLVEAGDKVPADLRLVRHAALRADESALTGESEPAAKDEDVVPVSTPVADRRNMLYSGTLVTTGSGVGVVVATGTGTELGQIHRLVGRVDPVTTPLTRKIAKFSRVLTVAILGLAALSFAVGLGRGEGVAQMFTAAVAVAVGAIPEGLPAAVTITLAIGVGRMARRGAVIRRLPAVETLGSTTVICTDKTGTLTENQMTVTAVWTPHAHYDITGVGYAIDGEIRTADGERADPDADQALRWSLLAGAACTDAALAIHEGRPTVAGDPTEGRCWWSRARPASTRTAGSTRPPCRSAHEHRDRAARPDGTAPERPARPRGPHWGRVVFGLLVVAVGVASLLDGLGWTVPWRLAPAIALIVIGLALLASLGGGTGRADLVVLGVIALVLAVAAAVGVDRYAGPVGDRSIVAARDGWPTPVQMAAGTVVVDLTRQPRPAGTARVAVGAGRGRRAGAGRQPGRGRRARGRRHRPGGRSGRPRGRGPAVVAGAHRARRGGRADRRRSRAGGGRPCPRMTAPTHRRPSTRQPSSVRDWPPCLPGRPCCWRRSECWRSGGTWRSRWSCSPSAS
ncbi:HAD-IC family P-type ATPase [Pseudonocardia lacus]|uniref:HAD-IC family P-type ATPase n=1 Tax=Pseudonocardia lacus TaxID=2835865 RepID=UPI0027E28CC4|nr:HAD-IC family P-type ATPase [Pseudonocardia lacus]